MSDTTKMGIQALAELNTATNLLAYVVGSLDAVSTMLQDDEAKKVIDRLRSAIRKYDTESLQRLTEVADEL